MYLYLFLYFFCTATFFGSSIYLLNTIESFKILNRFLYNDSDDDDEYQDNEKEKNQEHPIIPYEKKYMDEFLNGSNDNFDRISNFKNNFIIENTPLGNVSMYYNSERDCFEYYSDHTIPYRYLETIGRKYVITFRCKDIFIVMEEELEKQKQKQEEQEQKQQEQKEEEQKQQEQKQQEENQPDQKQEKKRNLFAKLKNYNQSTSAPIHLKKTSQQNQPPQTQTQTRTTTSKEPVLLKERTNNYVCKGPFSNWNPLKTIKKEEVSQIYKMTFKDFKEMSQNKNL